MAFSTDLNRSADYLSASGSRGGSGGSKDFLSRFVRGLKGEGGVLDQLERRNAYNDAMMAGTGRSSSSKSNELLGGSSSRGGMNNELTIVNHPGSAFGLTTIPGAPGTKGPGGILGSIAGAALGAFVPVIGPTLGASLGGGIGGAFS